MRLLLDHITKSYDGRDVLRDCSFTFPESGVSVLMGANGCGKSTLLRICSLLEHPDSGRILFMGDGAPLPLDIALRRRITLVLPRTGVFNSSVFHNVAYGLRVRGAARGDLGPRVLQALSFVGMDHLARRQALTLSSGETQRMGIARALAVEPEILFLDEPTASVDEENTEIIESIIRRLKQDGRTMVIMTTHDRDQAKRVADAIFRLRDGRISPLFGPERMIPVPS